jgi:ATP-binding cassette subfamily B protein
MTARGSGVFATEPRLLGSLRQRHRERWAAAAQLLRLARQCGPGVLVGTVLLHVTVGLLPILFIVAISEALSAIAGGASTGSWGNAVLWLPVALVGFLAQQALAPFQSVMSHVVTYRVDHGVIRRMIGFALTEAPLEALESNVVAEKLAEATRSFESNVMTPGAATDGALALSMRYAQLIGAVVVIGAAFNTWAALGAAAIALTTRRGQTVAFRQYAPVWKSLAPLRRRMTYLRDLAGSTRAAKEIRTLGLLDWVDRRYEDEARRYLAPLWSKRRAIYGPPFLLYAALGLTGCIAVLIAYTGGFAPHSHGVDVARLVISVQALVLCVRFGVYFPESDTKMQYGRHALTCLDDVERLCADPAYRAPIPTDAVRRIEGAPTVLTPGRQIQFESVSFAYRRQRKVLCDLDLTLRAGTSTAIVGLNGAGKTTLVKVLAGLYRPTGGRLLVDGVTLSGAGLAAWQRSLAITFQDFVRYEFTVRENVAMGAIAHVDDTTGIRGALERVGLWEYVDSLSAGIETPLSRHLLGGTELSGGQWQRIALARSLFAVRHGAQVLVLDEPTAQLDARGEAEFFDSFLDLTRDVTSLIVSHRFSTVRRAGHIAVIEDGRVLEQGRHDELVAAGGKYARLFEIQAERFGQTVGTQP